MEVTQHRIDADFFEMIYSRHWKKVFGICLYRIGDAHIAEEIVQDIFQALWERKDHFIVSGPIEHYLIRAAKLEIMDYYRTGTRRKNIRDIVFSDFSESDDSTELNIYGNDLQKHITALVEQLPLSCRQVYRYSRIQGLTNREVAEQLSISVKTVEYHLTRALRFLKTNLQEYKI